MILWTEANMTHTWASVLQHRDTQFPDLLRDVSLSVYWSGENLTLLLTKGQRTFLPCIRGPQPPGCGPVAVRGLLGTGPHSRRWAVGKRAKLHLPLPTAPHRSHYCLTHPPTPGSMEQLSSTKPVPGAKKGGDRCPVLCSRITCVTQWRLQLKNWTGQLLQIPSQFWELSPLIKFSFSFRIWVTNHAMTDTHRYRTNAALVNLTHLQYRQRKRILSYRCCLLLCISLIFLVCVGSFCLVIFLRHLVLWDSFMISIQIRFHVFKHLT